MAISYLSNINITNGTPVLTLTDTSSSATVTHTLDGVNYQIANTGTSGNFKLSRKVSTTERVFLHAHDNGNLILYGSGSQAQSISDADTTFSGDILTDTDSSSDIGKTGTRWANIWVDNINGSTPGTGTVTGTGVSSRVSYWNGTSSQTSTAGFTFDGSNLAAPGNITATAGALSAGTTVTSTTSMSAGSTMTIGTIAEVGSDTDKFLMSDSGVVKYVT